MMCLGAAIHHASPGSHNPALGHAGQRFPNDASPPEQERCEWRGLRANVPLDNIWPVGFGARFLRWAVGLTPSAEKLDQIAEFRRRHQVGEMLGHNRLA